MDIQQLRNQIDQVDDQLVKLFAQRMALSAEVADYKKTNNMPIYVPAREREILQQVAEKAGLSDRTYADIERGKVNMRIQTFIKICDVLQVTPNDIITSENPSPIETSGDLLERLDTCDSSEQETILGILDIYLRSINK